LCNSPFHLNLRKHYGIFSFLQSQTDTASLYRVPAENIRIYYIK
jgi:hypothetical protein